MRGTVKRIQPISWLDNYTPVAEGWGEGAFTGRSNDAAPQEALRVAQAAVSTDFIILSISAPL